MPFMGYLKQSTQVTKTILMVDSADHITGKTGLAAGITKYLTKNAGTPASATMTTAEEDATNVKGIYSLVFTTSHTDTLGDFQLHLTASGADPTDYWWTVVARLFDDLAYPATAGRSLVVDAAGLVDANVVKLGPTGAGTAQTARDVGAQLDAAVSSRSTLTAANVWDALLTGISTVGSIGKLIKDFLDAAITSRSTYAGGAVASVTGDVGGNVTGSVGSLATQAKADVNAEVVDALNTDTYAEPGQEAPPATASITKKLGWLYKAFRNRVTQTATTMSIYADDATTVDAKSTVSDNGTTFDRGEIATGP